MCICLHVNLQPASATFCRCCISANCYTDESERREKKEKQLGNANYCGSPRPCLMGTVEQRIRKQGPRCLPAFLQLFSFLPKIIWRCAVRELHSINSIRFNDVLDGIARMRFSCLCSADSCGVFFFSFESCRNISLQLITRKIHEKGFLIEWKYAWDRICCLISCFVNIAGLIYRNHKNICDAGKPAKLTKSVTVCTLHIK